METLKIDGCLASYEVTGDEVLTNELFAALVIESRKRSVLNLDVLLPTDRTSDRELLTNAGFTWAGTAQINRDGRAVTFIRFRTCVKSAGDGVATFGTQLSRRHQQSRSRLRKFAVDTQSLFRQRNLKHFVRWGNKNDTE